MKRFASALLAALTLLPAVPVRAATAAPLRRARRACDDDARSRRILRRDDAYAIRRDDIAGAVLVVVKDGKIIFANRLRLRRPARTHAGRSRDRRCSGRARSQALYLDGGDATGASRQDRPRRRRQQVHRLQDSASRSASHHDAQLDDAHGRLRGVARDLLVAQSQQVLPIDVYLNTTSMPTPKSTRRDSDRVFQLRRDARRLHRAARLGR